MHRDGRASSSTGATPSSASATPPHLVPVSLPPLPGRGLAPPGGPGVAQRLGRPPTPPPRPESSLAAPPPPPSVAPPPSSGPGRGSAPSVPSSDNILRDLPASLSSLNATPLATPITLNTPRAAQSRTQNLYVDTPFKGPPPQPPPQTHHGSRHSGLKASRHRPITVSPVPQTSPPSVITSPPQLSSSPDPKIPDMKPPETGPGLSPGSESIICVVCGRCRCVACGTPSALPSRWLCDNSCLCSAESAVDTLSCMCCVKAAFYHCGERMSEDTDKEDSWVDSPCSCSSKMWMLRWGCLALLSLPLPCLLCYPLLKGLNTGLETCYQAATARGCRCPDNINNTTARGESQQQSPNSSLSSPTDSHKRLLG